jgi:hypothetical protein
MTSWVYIGLRLLKISFDRYNLIKKGSICDEHKNPISQIEVGFCCFYDPSPDFWSEAEIYPPLAGPSESGKPYAWKHL